MSDLYTIFKSNLEQNKMKPLLLCSMEKETTWENVDILVDHISSKLYEYGSTKGDRVGILLHNCKEYISILFGIWNIGAIAVPINSYLRQFELNAIIENAGIKILFTSERFNNVLKSTSQLNLNLKVIFVIGSLEEHSEIFKPLSTSDLQVEYSGKSTRYENKPNDTAMIIYTSGTTASPKGVELTHHNLISNLVSIKKTIEITQNDLFLLYLPMFHSFTLTTLILLPIFCSSKILILTSVNPRDIVKALVMHPVTIFVGIPALYNLMIDERYNIDPEPFKKVKYFISGSAPLTLKTIEMFQKKFGIPILEGYGLSETSPVVALNPIELVKQGSVGKPIHDVFVSIFDDDSNPMKTNEIGEIVIKGNNVMKGYFQNPQATENTFINSWFRTGDLGYLDDDGYIFIVGRKKELIIVAGINVYPKEIEDVLLSNTNIEEAAVIGIPDTCKGEVPAAFVKLKEDSSLSPEALKSFCRERLANYKIPYHYKFVKDFPRNATGKILKRALNIQYNN
jgi:long-chain acyl-CoA synthetase